MQIIPKRERERERDNIAISNEPQAVLPNMIHMKCY